MKVERVKTGIPGLDEILKGGIPKGELILVTGTAGVGKTILCNQYCYTGAKKYGENAVYLSFEEPVEFIKENMTTFGWDIKKLEDEGKFVFIKYDPYRIEDVLEILESTIREIKAERVVIDSISALGLHMRDREELRKMIFNLSFTLRRLGCTALIVSEIVQGTKRLSRYGVEEFVADGVLVLHYERIQSTFSRSIHAWKLRGSAHSEKLHPYTISDKGITIDHMNEAIYPENK